MAILHFDTDAGRNTVTLINNCINQVRNELNTVRNKVNNLTGSEWEGTSSDNFQQEIQTWADRKSVV